MPPSAFRGSFDPGTTPSGVPGPALDQLALRQLRWIPAGQPWQKARRLAPAAHREAMVRLAIEAEPRFVLDPIELRREGVTYTIDTVRELQAAHPAGQWFLILGQDQYAGLHTWHDWQALLGLVTPAIAARPGVSSAVDPEVACFGHVRVDLPPMALSATDIRHRIAAGESIAEHVPDAVRRYIERHRLYARAGSDPHTRS